MSCLDCQLENKMCQAKLFINYHPDNLLECWNGRSVTLVLPKLPDDDFPHVEVVLVPDSSQC